LVIYKAQFIRGDTALSINSLPTNGREGLAEDAGARIAFRMVEILAANPFITARGVEQQLGVAFNTEMRAMGQLEKRGIVNEIIGARGDRVYCVKALLDILEEPTRLQPTGQF
jgi:DNA-binding transcriptional MocR family regulator